MKSDFTQVERENALPERDGIVFSFAVNQFMIMGRGTGDVVRIN